GFMGRTDDRTSVVHCCLPYSDEFSVFMPHPAAMNLGDVRKPIITYSLSTKKTQKRMTVWKIIP
ncbi:hypothetical protein, partial [Vibrio furnissii]|uniref:hypothetical protein n=1 Tax=Vibrio furnissii TaxID=29494 RepID=UPI001EE9E29F